MVPDILAFEHSEKPRQLMLFGDLWHNQLWHNQLRQWLVEGCYKLMFGIWHKYSSWFKVAAVSSEYNNNSDYHISSLLGEKLPQQSEKQIRQDVSS